MRRPSSADWLVSLLLVASGAAIAQHAPQTRDDVTLLPPNATLAGPGPITASPMTMLQRPSTSPAADMPARTSAIAKLLGNGTPLSYDQGGANAIGDTGGLTTGAKGSAGALAGGGGIHVGAVVIPPGHVDAAMQPNERASSRLVGPAAAGGADRLESR